MINCRVLIHRTKKIIDMNYISLMSYDNIIYTYIYVGNNKIIIKNISDG